MNRSETFPDLRIVPLVELLIHEDIHAQRSDPLTERLRAEGILKNPPIVAPMGGKDPRFVVLDGANRTLAFRKMEYPHALVQVVNYESDQVQLLKWSHVISAVSRNKFSEILTSVDGLEFVPTDIQHARAALARREVLAYIVYDNEPTYMIQGGFDLRSRLELLNGLVDAYKDECVIHRVNTDHMADWVNRFEQVVALVVFPTFEPIEIITLVRDGLYLPAGITRHVIQGRAVRLNYPLSELSLDEPLYEKNQRLEKWIRARLTKNRIRFYNESTYSFDD